MRHAQAVTDVIGFVCLITGLWLLFLVIGAF